MQAQAAQQQRDTDDEHHGRQVPQVERHDPRVDRDREAPGAGAPEPPRQRRLESQQQPALKEAEEAEGHARRERVVERGIVQAHHRHRVRSEPNEQDRPQGANPGQQQPLPYAVQSPVEPGEPDHVDGAEDDDVVREAREVAAGSDADPVDQTAQRQQPDDRPPSRALPQGQGRRCERNDHDVRREEPGRHERHLGRGAERPTGHARGIRDRGDHQPGEEQWHDRGAEATQARTQPPGIRLAPGASRAPGQRIGVAADEEEHRHDLDDPGERVRPRREVEDLVALEGPVAHDHCRSRPVAEGDDEDCERTEEVDDPVARVGCRCRQRVHVAKVHAVIMASHVARGETLIRPPVDRLHVAPPGVGGL